MNTGLKNYTKQLTQTVGNVADVSVNINEEDANLIMSLPLLKTIGLSPIDLSLIFNYQNKNEDGLFGKGIRLNLFSKLIIDSDKITVKNADGSTDVYLSSKGYKNDENQTTIEKVYDDEYEISYHYKMIDKYGNYRLYSPTNLEYPDFIRTKNGDAFSIEFTYPTKSILNYRGDVITFECIKGKVDTIIYKHNDVQLYHLKLEYSGDNYLICLSYFKENTLLSSANIEYGDNTVVIADVMANYRMKYTLNGNKVISFVDSHDLQFDESRAATITYSGHKTIIVDNKGNKNYVFFDNNNLPLFEIDNDGNVIETEYDLATKVLTAKSSVVRTQNTISNLFPSNSVVNFVKDSGVSVTNPYSVSSSFFNSILKNTVCKISGTGSLSYSVSCQGLATDSIQAIIWGHQLTNYSQDCYVEVTLKADGEDKDLFKKTITDDNFDLMTLGLSAKKSYKNITLTIKLVGNASIEIGGIQVIKKDFGTFFEYDDAGNAAGQSSGTGSISTKYNSKNQVVTNQGTDSTMYDFEYDDKGNLLKAKTAYGVAIENEYNSNNNLIRNTVTNGKTMLETKKDYNSYGFVTNETDELGNKTTYEYDSFGRVTRVMDALYAVTTYNYDEYDNLKQIILQKNSENISANYEYDNKQRLEKITLKDGPYYNFQYDDKDNLVKVLLNNQTIFKYEYDSDDALILQQYGENGDAFKFEYNSRKELIKIYYVNPNKVSSLRYIYEYNNIHQIEKIKNASGVILNSYVYDVDGRVIKMSGINESIDYQYDNLGNVNEKITIVGGKKTYQSYDNIARSKGACPESIVDTLSNMAQARVATFVNDLYARGRAGIINCLANDSTVSEATITRDGVIPCVELSGANNKLISYVLPDSPMPMTSGMAAFWFKPKNVSSKQYLFCQKRRDGVGFVGVYLKNSKLYLEITNYNGEKYTIITSSGNVKQNQWNFFSVDYIFRNDTGYSEDFISQFDLVLNSVRQSVSEQSEKYIFDQGVKTTYHIGHAYDNSSYSSFLSGKLALVMIGNNRYIDIQQIINYYRLTKDYIIDNQMVDSMVSSVDFSQTNLHTIDSNIQNAFEIYPLQTSIKSLNGKSPVSFDIRTVSSNDKDRTFNFNNINKHYAYVADGTTLEYDFGLSNTGTIVMRAFTDVDNNKQYFFEGKDTKGYKLALYRDENSKLCIDLNGKQLVSNLIFKTNVWQTVGLSFNKEIVSDSQASLIYENLRIYLDGNVYEFKEMIFFDYSNLTFMIGRTVASTRVISNLGMYNTVYPLYGQIEMLAVNNNFNSISTLNLLKNELIDYSKVSEFDELGLIKKVDLHKSGNTILSNTYSYKCQSDGAHSSKQISNEVISFGNNKNDRSYQTDALGNITSITDSLFGSHNYTYDYRGFLTKEDAIEYKYDNNGNITKAGNDTFTYDNLNRLRSVNGWPVSYSDVNPGNPRKNNNIEYEFEGRRLKSISEPMGIDEQKTVDYTYDSNGLIIKKVLGYWYDDDRDSEEFTTQYYYDGDKLITEINQYCRLDFLYDESGMLYGLIKDNSSKYFYVRDYLHNILGIVDQNGKLVVKYSYDAYGNRKGIEDTSGCNLGTRNPFRYKGYYYDDDTNMYYCKSRFYVPEWRRWLNDDNFVNLQVDEVGNLNLWIYAVNNPVQNIDESGDMPRWLKCALCVGASALAVAAIAITAPVAGPVILGAATSALTTTITSSVTQMVTTGRVDMCQLLYDASIGAVSGAIGGSAFGKFSYLISNTAVSGLSAVGSDWMNGTLGGSTVRSSLTNAFFALVFSANHAGAQQNGKATIAKMKDLKTKIKYNNNKGANKYAAHLCENLSKVKGKFSVTCQQEIVHNMWKNGLTSIAQDGFVKLFSIF